MKGCLQLKNELFLALSVVFCQRWLFYFDKVEKRISSPPLYIAESTMGYRKVRYSISEKWSVNIVSECVCISLISFANANFLRSSKVFGFYIEIVHHLLFYNESFLRGF